MQLSKNRIEDIIVEELNKSDIINLIKKDKDIEKKVKDIVTDVIVNLFKTLWQHKNFYENIINK